MYSEKVRLQSGLTYKTHWSRALLHLLFFDMKHTQRFKEESLARENQRNSMIYGWICTYVYIYIHNIHTQHNHFSIKPLPGLSHLISSWSVQTAMASHPWSHSRNGRSVGVFHVCFLCLHPWKLTCPPKRDYFSREYIFQPLIFRGHVSFQGSSFQPGGIVRNEFTEHKLPSVISV